MIDSAAILTRMRVDFQAEASDLLDELDTALLELEGNPTDSRLIDRVFRALHTIKGSGASAQFMRLSRFAHKIEEVFNCAREARVEVSPALMDIALRACDLLRALLDDGDATPEFHQDLEGELTTALASFIPASQYPIVPVEPSVPATLVPQNVRTWNIEIRPCADFYLAADPISLLAELLDLGSGRVSVHLERIPPLGDINPESCYVWWSVLLATSESESDLRNVFVFVEDECELILTPLTASGLDKSNCLVVSDLAAPFVCEALEQLAELDNLLVALEKNPADTECIGSLFRVLHSFKGNTGLILSSCPGMVGSSHVLRVLQQVAHAAETSLDTLRECGTASLEELPIFFGVADYLRALTLSINGEETAPVASPEIVAWLQQEPSQQTSDVDSKSSKHQAFKNTSDQCLMNMGQCSSFFAKGSFDLQAASSYQRSTRTLLNASEYCGYKELHILLTRHLATLQACISEGKVSDSQRRVLELELGSIRLAQSEPSRFIDSSAVTTSDTNNRSKSNETNAAQSIRVDQEKLDRLMRVVSELLVARGSLPMLAKRLADEFYLQGPAKELKDASAQISRISDDLQSTVMSIRMLPIDTVFQRFPRLVRDLARTLHKDIDLRFRGEDTEVDKSVIQVIADPLVHIVRNAVDHGIESPARRHATGKPKLGTIELRARNEGTDVVIEIVDDGQGLDPEKLVQKAIEKGMLTDLEAKSLSPDAALRLILLPGFSTAESVTDVSGRGVGMDVAVNNIQKLKGSITIESVVGKGTTFRIKLPSSVMISRGILVESGTSEYILPIDQIADMIKVPSSQLHAYQGRKLIQTKTGVYPVIAISEHFEADAKQSTAAETCVVLIHATNSRYGLIVDRFVTEVEVVIKRLTSGLELREDFLGASILGDGRVVLVLNPEANFVGVVAV